MKTLDENMRNKNLYQPGKSVQTMILRIVAYRPGYQNHRAVALPSVEPCFWQWARVYYDFVNELL